MIVASGQPACSASANVTGPGFKSRLGPFPFALFASSAHVVMVKDRWDYIARECTFLYLQIPYDPPHLAIVHEIDVTRTKNATLLCTSKRVRRD